MVGSIVEAAGVTAAIGICLLVGLCIVANAAFKRDGLPSDDVEDDQDVA